jgi:transcriptional regulator with XRE-family HTH domain
MQFHEKLRVLRKQKSLTLRELEEQIGISYKFIHELESGRKYPNVKHAMSISRFFGVSLDMLLKDELDLDEDDR